MTTATITTPGPLSLRLCPARAKAEQARPAAEAAHKAASERLAEATKAVDRWLDLRTNPGRVLAEQVDPAVIPAQLAAAEAELVSAGVAAFQTEQAFKAAERDIEQAEGSAVETVNREGARRLAEIRSRHDALKADLNAVIEEEAALIQQGSRILGAVRKAPGVFQLRPAIG
jgi:hypothetical protein